MEGKQLYRSKTDRWLGGVCGGIGEYFGIDPLIVRLIFFVLAFANGVSILIYLVLWVVVPEDPRSYDEAYKAQSKKFDASFKGEDMEEHVKQSTEKAKEEIKTAAQRAEQRIREEWSGHEQRMRHQWRERNYERHGSGRLIWGLILIALGVVFLLQEFVHINIFTQFWPVLLIILGLAIMLRPGHRRYYDDASDEVESDEDSAAEEKK